MILDKKTFDILKFQYNTCFGSTFLQKTKGENLKTFQYNTCFGSTVYNDCNSSNKCWISIQHLFRFDLEPSATLETVKENFNTTLVSVRHIRGEAKFIVRIFQYNTCFGSTIPISSLALPFRGFQYNTCFGSTVRELFVKMVFERFQYNTCFGSTLWAWLL